VLVSLISPYRAERRAAREAVGAGSFLEVFVDVPLAVAEARDPKGLYAKARRGELPHFTGIDSPYEEPQHPDLHLETATRTAEEAADLVVARLLAVGTTG
jgi:bifunctional enzyme CysN/CysC